MLNWVAFLDNQTRLQYLQAMGITVWLPKTATTESTIALESPVTNSVELKTESSSASVKNAQLSNQHDSDAAIQEQWRILQAEVAECRRCNLCNSRTQTVFGSGNKTADWMIIGEAPGQQEDQQGLPFVGNAGLLLTEMLRAMGLNRDAVFIANILKCRPPNNRDPEKREVENCIGYLKRQYELINPKIILAVGRVAAQNLLDTDSETSLSLLRGKVHAFNNTPVIVVYHPSYLLRQPLEKRKAWQDLQFALQTYKNIKG